MLSRTCSGKLRILLGILILVGICLSIRYKIITISDYGEYKTDIKQSKAFNRVRPPVDCVQLIKEDKAEQLKAYKYHRDHPKKAISNEEYINMTRDCDRFIETRQYIMSSSNEEEKNFPLAFTILVYKDIEHFERLLRAVYRPQNFYCVHVDKKSEATMHMAVGEIAGCFVNVIVLKNRIDVIWGTYSVMEPDILCMEALLKYKKWKYFINLTGQEFPLKTNWELVQVLKALNGSNLIGGTTKRRNPERIAGRPPPPINVTYVKGPVHIMARREFVDYVINNENAQKLLNWSKQIPFADEVFFSTLNHNPQLGIRGAYLGEAEYHPIRYPFISRYKIWAVQKVPCHGKYVHTICIFGVGELPALAATTRLFANKFHLDYQPLGLDCLEEHIYNRTQEELLGNRNNFNTSYYQNLDVARNHL